MTKLQQFVDDLIEREGGYVDHNDDLGGPTKYGITEEVARQNNYHGPMRDLPRSVAVEIYKDQFWTVPNFDRVAMISQPIAEELLDTGANMGITWSGRFLQRSLNALNNQAAYYRDLQVDGLIGNSTLAALRAFIDRRGPTGVRVMLKALNCLQGERYIALGEARERNETFMFGWIDHRISL